MSLIPEGSECDADLGQFLVESMIRINAEYTILTSPKRPLELDKNEFTKEIRRPRGWRLKVWNQLLNTVFKEVHSFSPQNDVESAATIMGLFKSSMMILDDFDEDIFDNIDPSKLGIDEESQKNNLEVLENIEDRLSHDRLNELILKERPEELSTSYKSFGKGLSMVGTSDKEGNIHFTHRTDATEVYMFLLIFGKHLQKMRSVEEIYKHIQSCGGEKLIPHSLESFKQICNRVGFTGSSYSKRKKRVKRQRKKG